MVIRVIYGPPAAGKTTYIETHRRADEVLIDMDALCVALGSADSHDHPDHIKALGAAARAVAIRKAMDRGIDAWVIDTWLRSDLLRDQPERCEYILVDPGQEITTGRATRAGRPASTLATISRWYADPPVPPRRPIDVDEPEDAPNLGETVTDWW